MFNLVRNLVLICNNIITKHMAFHFYVKKNTFVKCNIANNYISIFTVKYFYTCNCVSGKRVNYCANHQDIYYQCITHMQIITVYLSSTTNKQTKKSRFGENTPLLLAICTVSRPEDMIKTSIRNRILLFFQMNESLPKNSQQCHLSLH